MTPAVHVAILGASGYGAGELLRLCVQHPAAEVVSVTSSSHAGCALGELHPHLSGFVALDATRSVDLERLFDAEYGVLVSALPHGVSGATLDRMLNELEHQDRLRIVDLSGDLRLKDARLHARYYPQSALLPARRDAFVYGLPELFRDQVQGARAVANPGCLASAAILAVAPLATDELRGPVAMDAKTGSSGSGRQLKPTTHHPTRHANFRAYKTLEHQHEPEIRQALGDPRGERIQTSFVSQSMDTARGLYVTVHLSLAEPTDTTSLQKRYRAFYDGCPFVRIRREAPELQNVVGSNFCDLALRARDTQVIVMGALDNLVKGMAGTALQNINLMCGLPETTGLRVPSLRPV